METILPAGQPPRTELSVSKRELLEKRLRGRARGPMAVRAITRRPPESGPAPLSFIQQQLWFLHEFDPASPAYNIAAALRIEGALDVQALEQAINHLIERHQSLRTVFASCESGPVQVVKPFAARQLPFVDLQDFTPAERRVHAEEILKREAKKPFDLSCGPLFRATLLRLNESEHALLFVQHHIISDGWSLGVMFRDLETFYRAAIRQTSAEVPELPIQFSDFAAWQTQLGAEDGFAADLQFWREKLAGTAPSVDLPLDHERPPRPGFRGSSISMLLPRSFADALSRFNHLHGTTSFIFLLTALTMVLGKWSSQSDLVVGTVVACRTRREIENLVGCFMNFLPLRAKMELAQTGSDLLRHVKTAVLEAYVHQECPFEKVVQAVNPARRPAANPLYNVALLLQNFPVGVFQSAGLSSNFMLLNTESSLLDLRFIVEEKEPGIALHCEYDTDLFERETIGHLLTSYRRVLETLIQNPETALANFQITPELTAQAVAARKRRAKQTLAIAGTFTVEPVEDSLKYWMQQLEVAAQVKFAPYNQVFQQLLDPASLVRTNQNGVNVFLLRLEDLTQSDENGNAARLEQNVNDLVRALKSALPQMAAPTLICVCPPSKSANAPQLQRLEKTLVQELVNLPNAYVTTHSEILDLYPVADYHDPHAESLGRVPYATSFFNVLGTVIARRFHALIRPPRKVIVLDCDQTLWTGVCGEDGASGIRCDAPRKALQQFMLAQHDAGMLLAVCSKNNEADVAEVFDTCSDMVLRKKHFAAWRANWQPKSANLHSLASELRLGLDSFVFVDDNPVECAEVEANCPGVLTLQVPGDLEQIPTWLKHLWVFDKLKVTAEDRNRTAMYHQNRLRDQLMADSLSMADFIAGLRLQIDIKPAVAEQLPRLAQLTERTNQFNCTTIRRSEAEMTQLWRSRAQELLAVSVSDRFGDYGLVGLIIYGLDVDAVLVDTFLLSCRVLGKGVEHRILATLGKIAQAAGLGRVDIPFRSTARNKPAWDFLNEIGAPFRQGANGSTAFRFPAEVAAETGFNPQTVESPAATNGNVPSASGEEMPGAKFRRFNWIALQASDATQISQLIAGQSHPLGLQGAVVGHPPQTELERQLLNLWRELLHNESIGTTDDFFRLGGTSLLAVRLCAQIAATLGHKVPLATLFRSPTVEQLARTIERAHSRHQRSSLVAIQHKGTRPPLILVHGAGGGILWGYANLAAHLGHDQPVYALEPRHTKSAKLLTVEDMAAQYVRDLRAFQSKGPYYLGGYCFGGYVAYEMARLLEREGEQIGLLVLLDSAAPNGGYERITWWQPAFYPRLVRNTFYWLKDFRDLQRAEREDFVQRKWAVLKRKIARAFSSHATNGSGIDLTEYIAVSQFPEHELELWKLHLTAGANYKPMPYGGKVLLLRTRGQPILCSFDPQYGWGKLARGGLEVRVISGAHEKIFVEPDIQALACELKRALDTAQSFNSLVPPTV